MFGQTTPKRYTITVDEGVLQILVDTLRRMPHYQVDALLDDLRAQIERQTGDADKGTQ